MRAEERQPMPDRRALLTTAVALPLVAALPVPAASPRPVLTPEWRDFIRQVGWLHRGGAAAAIKAFLSGMDLDEFSGVVLHSRRPDAPMPVLMFGDWHEGDYFTVTPAGVSVARRI